MPKKIKEKRNIQELAMITVALILVIVSWETFLLYPIKLFVIYLHESSHALAALLSGAKVSNIEIGFNLGGKINTEGGNEILIASSGYLGSLIFGIILFISAHIHKKGKWLISILIIALSIPLFFTQAALSFIMISLISLSTLVLILVFLQYHIVALITKILSLSSCFYVLYDLKSDLLTRGELVVNDSTILSNLVGIDSLTIGIVWLFLSGAAILFTIKLAYFRK